MASKSILNQYGVVDLFCGIGGLSHGFVQEGLKVLAGVDFDETCKFAFEENNKGAVFIHRKVEDLSHQDIQTLFTEANRTKKILVGCAPCQPFSTYTNKKINSKSEKWKLLYDFATLIEKVQPDIVSMENVPLLKKFEKSPVFGDFVRVLESNGYLVTDQLVFCPDYGIPQKRTRLVLLASKLGKINLLRRSHTEKRHPTVRDAIGKLEPIKSGEQSKTDPLHRASALSEINLQRIKSSKPGGSWKDWDENLRLDCHKKASGESYGSVYGRMVWDEPSPTMTTQCTGIGNGRFGHPEQDRAISLREAAIFQTFPDEYKFFDPQQRLFPSFIARQIGNAVPVRLGRVIARSIIKHIREYDS